jgi:hypothetical protein
MMGLRTTEKCLEIPYWGLETYEWDVGVEGYRGVDDFFNVREANSNICAGQWQFELRADWQTFHNDFLRRDDDVTTTPSIKYGITDDLNVELEVLPINFGDGLNINPTNAADGTGDVNVKLFWQFLHEEGLTPAMALWGESRIPSGENSEKMDGALHYNLTKTIADGWRFHFTAYGKSANGSRGDRDRSSFELLGAIANDFDFSRQPQFGDRRHFQWGAGIGFDVALDDNNLLVFNWLNQSSNFYGVRNNNLLEAGWVHHLNDCQQLMVAFGAEPHSDSDAPHYTGKVQWSIAW